MSSSIVATSEASASPEEKVSTVFFKHPTPLTSNLELSVKAVEYPFPMGALTETSKLVL
jgi:hypothetical protein